MNDSIRSENPEIPRKHPVWGWVLLGALLVAAPILLDYLMIGRPVSNALSQDERNAGFTMSAHRQYRVSPSVLVVDLGTVENASAVDLLRGVFVTAETLHARGTEFKRVHLARNGRTIFVMKGDEFRTIGEEYGGGENPLYLIRTFPEKLYRPDGEAAFGRWTGGMFGVLGRQMEDVTAAVSQWTGSEFSSTASY